MEQNIRLDLTNKSKDALIGSSNANINTNDIHP